MTNHKIRRSLQAFYDFLSQPLFLSTRPLLVLLVVPLAFAVFQPLWHISLEAPQYPQGLTVDIYTHTIEGGRDGRDLNEINILNHYVGMKKIQRSDFADLDWMPFGFGVLLILTLRVAAIGGVRELIDLAVVIGYFGLFSAGRFVYKLYVYGHDLAPDAPVKVKPFMPAVFGSKEIGNFTSHAHPGLGTYLFTAFALGVFAVTLIHLIGGFRREKGRTAEPAAG